MMVYDDHVILGTLTDLSLKITKRQFTKVLKNASLNRPSIVYII